MSKNRTGTRFVPKVEGLEDRVVPAGNVFVSVFEGVLYVGGDDVANAVKVTGVGRTGAIVSALDATTTFNGQSGPLQLDGITRDIYVRLYGGDDVLVLENVRPPRAINADTGAGNDSLTITNAAPRKETILATGDGNDTAAINDSLFRRYLFLDTGAGDDAVTATRAAALDFVLTNPAGSDFFNNVNSTLVRPNVTGFTAGPERTAPTPTLTSAAPDPTRDAPVEFAVTFDEAVTGFDAADITLTNGTVATFTALDARAYTFTVTPTADGPVTATIPANVATDAVGNRNVASETVSRTFDATGPTVAVTALTTSDTTPVVSGTVGEADASVSIVVNGRTYSAAVGGTVWAASVTDPLADGTYVVTATATDRLGNARTATGTLVVDATPPTTQFSASPASPVNGTSTTVTITFSEPVTGFGTADVTVANGTKGAFILVSPTVYTVAVTSNRDGEAEVRVAANGATDAAGNGNGADSFSVVFDTGQPTLDLATGSDSGPDGDLRTDAATVSLVGVARPGATVRLYAATVPGTPGTGAPLDTVTADGSGAFAFANVALAVGPNSFAVQATDTSSFVSNTFSQTFVRNTPPTVFSAIPAQTLTAGGAAATVDLTNVFVDAETVVRFATTYPTGQSSALDINLFDATPNTTANFLAYVNAGASQNYNGSVFHRKIDQFVLQGGGFKFVDSGTTTATAFPAITEFAAIDDEFADVSNTRGTIAMAKPGAPDTATSEFFFNLGDNSRALDSASNAGGFAVFGQVMNGGLAVLDAVAALDEFGGTGVPGAGPFPVSANADTEDFPANIGAADLALITTATELTAAQRLQLAVDAPNNAVATAAIVNGVLTITPVGAGTVTFTVTATDLDGSATTTTVMVTVS